MKKILTFLGLVISVLLLSGCKNDSMDNIKIYTSVYPVEYVTEELYKDHAKIYNMYPRGINPYDYKLTNKQINDYSESDLIIYNGLSVEKEYIVKMINKNKKLRIIDSTSNIEYNSSLDEVWINPSNILMMAQNVKEGLKEYINSTLLLEKIDENYEELKIKISSIDAELKEIVENSNKKTIIVQDDELTFLSKYGLNIYSLDNDTMTDKIFNDTKKAINEIGLKYIYVIKDNKTNDNVKALMEEYPELQIIYIDPINNISTSDKNNGINYVSLMNDNLDKLKQELY